MPSKVCPQCGTEYDLNQQFCPTDGAALLAPAAETDFVGQIFGGRYRMLERLGAGGMGNVYLAEHVRLKKLAAVKVIRPAMNADPAAVARFNREAQNASMVNHPNVAAVYDFGEADGGIVFLAMEYVDGEPLSQIIARGPLEPARASRIVTQIADALGAAHRIGVVHRDLKPDNVMIARGSDGADFVKLVDFGISKVANVDDQKITSTGMVIGTPTYMSPEQARGSAKLDGRSDIYSLGVLTFQGLTAALPFKGDTPQEQLVSRLVDSPATLSAVRPDVRWAPAVEHVLAKALALEPDDRYASAPDFARALDAAIRAGTRSSTEVGTELVGAPLTGSSSARGAGAQVTVPTPLDSRRNGVARGIAVGLGLAGLIGVAGVVYVRSRRPGTDVPAPQAAAKSVTAPRDSASAPPATTHVATNLAPVGQVTRIPVDTTPSVRPQGRGHESANASVVPTNRMTRSVAAPDSVPVPNAVRSEVAANPNRPANLNKAIQALAAGIRTPNAPIATYRRAYDWSTVLLKRAASPSDSGRILFVQARAAAMMGDRIAACSALLQMKTLARGAQRELALERFAQRLRCD